MAQSADYSGYFVDVLTSIRRDPTIFFSWSDGQCKELLLWLCTSDDPANPVLVGHDYTVLHCLLRTPTFPIDCPLKPPGRHKETAFSLAVEGGHFELGKYLLKMGASPDVLIGWDPVLHRESYFALDRMVDTKAELVWRDFILQFCKTPCREAEVVSFFIVLPFFSKNSVADWLIGWNLGWCFDWSLVVWLIAWLGHFLLDHFIEHPMDRLIDWFGCFWSCLFCYFFRHFFDILIG